MAKNPLALLIFAGFGLVACTGGDGAGTGTPSDVVDVPPALEIPIDNDQQAQPRKAEVSGIMPGDFPESLPLYLPSSLINFGNDSKTAFVELLSPDSRSKVESELKNRLRANGWSSQPAGGTFELSRQGQKARLTLGDGQPGTLYRYEY